MRWLLKVTLFDLAKSSSHFVFEGDEEIEQEEAAAEPAEDDDQGQALQDIDVTEEADDLELAWENLDVARIILAKQDDRESQLRLADVHLALGDVSLESENFDQAVTDFTSAVEIKTQLLAQDDRERAEAHYKLALAYEYTEQTEAAIEQVNASIQVLQKKMESLNGTTEGKGKGTAPVLSEQEAQEVKEIESLFPEMEAKLADLTTALEKEVDGGVIGEEDEDQQDKPVQDISNLVKKRKEDVVEYEATKKAKLE